MYLKSIEIQGFKSFANKTVLDFSPGITGIVGPNGSGKSNISDAVRWVLGEQKVKQLRGNSMQDVIFSGTALRRAQGYAYVSMCFDNADHALNLPYEEITVSRRLYRSGESEYRLNDAECRLKDIHELFYDTGIGKEGYSLIGQGQIDKILSGKAEERRALFDEAVGIVKFKRRKDISQKKLEEEQANMERIQDILSELEKQLAPLERQSGKAKNYLQLRDKLLLYEANLFLLEMKEAEKGLEELAEKIENLSYYQKEEEEKQNRLTQAFLAMEREGDALEAEEQRIRQREEEYLSEKAEIERRISQLREDISGKESSKKHFQDQIEKLKEESSRLLGKMEDLAATLFAMQEQFSSLLPFSKDKSEVQLDIDFIRSTIKEAERTIQNCFGNNFSFEEAPKLSKGEEENLGEQFLAFQEKEEELKKAKEAFQSLLQTMQGLSRELQEKRQELESEKSRLALQERAVENQSLRLDNLENLAERYEGFGNAVRFCMREKAREKGLIGVVAELISVPKDYELALETVLGSGLQQLVCEDEGTAKRLIEKLKRERQGRASFLPLPSLRKNRDEKYDSLKKEAGVIGVFADLIKVPDSSKGLENYLLSRVLLVKSMEEALSLEKKYHHSLRIVTLEGELLQAGGAISGGAYKNNSSLMGRKREMEELKESIEKGKEACNTIRKAVEEKVKACNRLEQELSTKEEERHQQEKGISELELMLQAKMQLEYQTLSTKTDFLTEQMHGYSDALEKLFAEKFDLEEAEKQSKESVLHQEEEILKLQEKLSDGEKAFSDRKVSLQSIQEQKQKIAEKQKAYFAEKEKFAEAQLNQEKEALRLENQKEKLEEQSAKSAQYILEEYGLKFSEVKQYYREELCEDPALSKEIQEMKGNIRSLGPINLDSIQQFEEVSERYSFLHQQVEDLLASEKSLQEIIADLDRGMRKQFHENFSKIQVEFNKVFRVLFGGGQGRLEMEEGEDVLESGIRIVAEPPGKKLQNMMQLSGGEKALTAISLLFALQSLKPSPFCLLDEIEAALDDSNVVRFAEYLYHLIKNTQFIVITHRRGTMERADRLFGVTMQEKGISTLVSVDLVEDQLQ